MDSNDLERERGITILAKNTAVKYRRRQDQHHRHPRPRRLRRRGRARAEHGRWLPAAGRRRRRPDAADALRADARRWSWASRPIVVINKIDRPNARPARSSRDDPGPLPGAGHRRGPARLRGHLHQRQGGRAGTTPDELADVAGAALRGDPRAHPAADRRPRRRLPDAGHRASSYDEYRGRIGIGRVARGRSRGRRSLRGAHSTATSRRQQRRQARSSASRGSRRVAGRRGLAGDIVADHRPRRASRSATRSPDADAPSALPRLEVEEPTVQMTFGVNTSPLAGRDGKFVTCRQLARAPLARA